MGWKNWRNILKNPETCLGIPRRTKRRRSTSMNILSQEDVEALKKIHKRAAIIREEPVKRFNLCWSSSFAVFINCSEKYDSFNGCLPVFEPMKTGIKNNPKYSSCNERRRYGLLKDRRVRKMDRVRSIKDLPFSEYCFGVE